MTDKVFGVLKAERLLIIEGDLNPEDQLRTLDSLTSSVPLLRRGGLLTPEEAILLNNETRKQFKTRHGFNMEDLRFNMIRQNQY